MNDDKNKKIIKPLSVIAIATAFVLIPGAVYTNAFTGEDIFGGANGLMKDAIEVIRNTDTGEAGGASFNMEIEPAIERDLSGTILDGISIFQAKHMMRQ